MPERLTRPAEALAQSLRLRVHVVDELYEITGSLGYGDEHAACGACVRACVRG